MAEFCLGFYSRFILCTVLLYLAHRPLPAFGIRKDGFIVKRCKNTIQGRYLLTDNVGYVCNPLSVDPSSRCCPESGKQYSCQGCNLLSKCCDSYEFCVSCCIDPQRTTKELALKVKIGKPITSGTYTSSFDFCSGRCRHNSASVIHENAYASDFHHCFSLQSNSSGSIKITDNLMTIRQFGVKEFSSERRLTGINIVIGKQGESCSTVCQSKGQLCVSNKLPILNKCEILQKYMNCKGTCLPSVGADQPAQVSSDAPQDLSPGACLYTQSESVLSCDGSHSFTKRLCPCV